MSTPGVYHDECGGYHEYSGVFSTLGGYHEYTGGIPRCMWGYHEYTGGYHDYTRACSVHRRDIMSTPGDFGTNKKKPLPNFEDFCSCTFVTMDGYMLAFRTSDSLLKYLYQVARAQTQTHFLFHL